MSILLLVNNLEWMTYSISDVFAGAFKRMRMATIKPRGKYNFNVDNVQLGQNLPENAMQRST